MNQARTPTTATDRDAHLTQPPEPAEALTFGAQEALSDLSPAIETLIRDRALEIPKAAQVAYLKAARGKASPRLAIGVFCLECMGWDRKAVRGCTSKACALYQYRPGGAK